MSDTYQAVFDATRSRLGNCDVGEAIRSACNFDASYAIEAIKQEFAITAGDMRAPSVLMRPELSIDGDQWCALYGTNLQDGVAGFGKSPGEAMAAFDAAWLTKLTNSAPLKDQP